MIFAIFNSFVKFVFLYLETSTKKTDIPIATINVRTELSSILFNPCTNLGKKPPPANLLI